MSKRSHFAARQARQRPLAAKNTAVLGQLHKPTSRYLPNYGVMPKVFKGGIFGQGPTRASFPTEISSPLSVPTQGLLAPNLRHGCSDCSLERAERHTPLPPHWLTLTGIMNGPHRPRRPRIFPFPPAGVPAHRVPASGCRLRENSTRISSY